MTTHWTRVDLCHLDRDGNYVDVGPRAQERVTYLAEYRERGSIYGAFLCTADELETLEDDAATEAGPRVEEIDWSGFPS